MNLPNALTDIEYDICILVKSQARTDARVMKEAISLATSGWRILLIGLKTDIIPEIEIIDGVTIWSVGPEWTRLSPKLWSQWLLELTYRVLRLMCMGSGQIPSFQNKIKWYEEYIKHYIGHQIWGIYAEQAVKHIRARSYHVHDYDALRVADKITGLIVYDSHEIFFDRQTQTSINNACHPVNLTSIGRADEKRLVQKVTAVITVGEGCASHLEKTLEIPHPLVIYNAVDFRIPSKKVSLLDFDGRRVIMHTGNITGARHLRELVASLQYLPEDVVLALMGRRAPLKDELLTIAHKTGVSDRLFFVPYVDRNDVCTTLSQATLGAVLITAVGGISYQLSVPNKLLEAIAAGLPIIAGQSPEVKRIVEHYQIGVTCDPQNPQDIARGILDILDNGYEQYKENALKARKEFNWENEERKLIKLYQQILD